MKKCETRWCERMVDDYETYCYQCEEEIYQVMMDLKKSDEEIKDEKEE